MTLPEITAEDIDVLASSLPDLDFSDAERRAVLFAMDRKDINAAPGSGKTTVLVAKLLLLARKWSDPRKGICVLSHTNVAREEIQLRLGNTLDGSQLLGHPHYIGTIHGLINQFVALPSLRSAGRHVDIIDDDVFARRALSLARTYPTLRSRMDRNQSVSNMVKTLTYKGAELVLTSTEGAFPGPNAKSLQNVVDLKRRLSAEGVFRHADMFAFAERALGKRPGLRRLLSRRFPFVVIDEMQDTSWEQERLLNLMFDDSVVIQRFGDVNQRILSEDGGSANLTFPAADALSISTSKRFGPWISGAVELARLSGTAVTGVRENVHPPMLLTYDTQDIERVIPAFGQRVLSLFQGRNLADMKVKALCARKKTDAKTKAPGRALPDYWPSYKEEVKPSGLRLERFWALIAGSGSLPQTPLVLQDRTAELKRALFLVLRTARATCVEGIRDGQQLLRRIAEQGEDPKGVRRLMRDLISSSHLAVSEEGRARVIEMIHGSLHPLLPGEMAMADFQVLPVFEWHPEVIHTDPARKTCHVAADGHTLEIELGTVHSMKGETHTATLVLESYCGNAGRFDVGHILPVIAGLEARNPRATDSHLAQYRTLYVSMSRPTSFLCLSANVARVTDEVRAALVAKGWVVEHLAG